MKYILPVLAFFLTSCAADMQLAQGTPALMPNNTQVVLAVVTSTPDITALQNDLLAERERRIGAEENVQQKQKEIDDYNRQGVMWTAEAEQRLFNLALIEKSNFDTQVAGTMVSASYTATAFPTVVEMQKKAIDLRNAELIAQAEAPDLLIKATDAKSYAEYYEWREIARLSAIGFFCFAMIALAFYLVAYGVRNFQIAENLKMETPAEIPCLNDVPVIPIPMTPNKDNPKETLRAEFHCTIEQLFAIADGIINGGMSLAFGQWEGDETVTRTALTIVRHALEKHKIVKPTRDGELDVKTVECETFMRYVVDHGQPPPPFICIPPKAPPPTA